MKNLLILFLSILSVINLQGQTCNTTVPTYTTISSACNSGNFTTSTEWTGNNPPPYVLTSGAYTIPAGVVVDIASSNFTLDYDLIVYGTLLVDGKLAMSNSTNKITVMSGGLVTCCASGYCGGSCASCGASDKISIGGTNVYCGAGGCGSVHGSFIGYSVLNNSGLPINLTSFSGNAEGNHVDLTWTTDSELNFDHFVIQRSSDGKTFTDLITIEGHGTTNIKQAYQWTDNTPMRGINYYRLTSVDYDNYRDVFHTIGVTYNGEKNVSLSPNPVEGTIVSFNSNFEFNGNITIYNNLGLIVYVSSLNENKINVSELKAGLYVVKISDGNFSKSIRLIIN